MQPVDLADGQSADIVSENIERLKELFPDAFSEGSVDFDVLRQLLGDANVLDEGEEKYGLNWHGKKKARQIALTPSTGTLLPCPEESVDWDTTQNLFIEGDNLEVLKLLQKSYANKVKMIYIDPPYNTGNEFIYPDKFQENLDTYLKYTGQVDAEGFKLSSNTQTAGRKHTNWLSMLYSRLKLSRQLLTDDGVILISIDDHEVEHLKNMLCEIFGDENFLATLIWNKQHSQQQGMFKKYHEYILVFAKNAEYLDGISGGEGFIEAGALKKISRANPSSEFEFPAGVRFEGPSGLELSGTFGESEKVTVVKGRFLCKNGVTAEPVTLSAGWTQKNQMKSWFDGNETFDTRGQRVVEFYFNSTGKLKCTKERGRITPPTILPEYGMVSESTASLANLMGADVFPTPKPVQMIEDFVKWFTADNDVVLDYFAGSGTTAHAVMSLNAKDGANRRYISVQLPEILDGSSEASRAGYATIADISKDRIRRAGQKIKSEITPGSNDLGCKVFKLSSSNIQPWHPSNRDLEGTLKLHQDHLVQGRSEQDVLYELLLKRGVDLATPIEEKTVVNKTLFSIGFGALFACLDNSIKKEEVEAVALGVVGWHRELAPSADTHVFFRDSAFLDDVSKTNMVAILEQNGISHVRSL